MLQILQIKFYIVIILHNIVKNKIQLFKKYIFIICKYNVDVCI